MPPEAAVDCRESESGLYILGDVIAGKYRLTRLLGEGGMGAVWLARNLDLESDVAIKLIRSDAPAREAADRLKREARATARVQHPSIVKVYDFGETAEGHPFIVMEVLEGTCLADVLDNVKTMSPVSAVATLLPIVEALGAAHAAGIVHRDIKPENIFLARVGQATVPKLLDFGIAKLEPSGLHPDEKITVDGAIMGSPAYMSPEQARGQTDVDHRADIWAVCAVLYEVVTGTPPFRGGHNYNALLRRIVEEDVPPIQDPAEGRSALWTVLSRGLRRDRKERFQSMTELARGLSAFLVSQAKKPALPRPRLELVMDFTEPDLPAFVQREDKLATWSSGLVRSQSPRSRRLRRSIRSIAALAVALATFGAVAWYGLGGTTFQSSVASASPPNPAALALTARPPVGHPTESALVSTTTVPVPGTTTVPVSGAATAESPSRPKPARLHPSALPGPGASSVRTPTKPLSFHWPRPEPSATAPVAPVPDPSPTRDTPPSLGDANDLKDPFR